MYQIPHLADLEPVHNEIHQRAVGIRIISFRINRCDTVFKRRGKCLAHMLRML